jgi:hypothetical protein
MFFLSGEPLDDTIYRVEDDVFIDRIVGSLPSRVSFDWRGRTYQISVPGAAELPCFLRVDGVADPPEGDLVLVLRRQPGMRDLFGDPGVFQSTVRVSD